MKAWFIAALLALSLHQSVPKQADKPRTNQDSGKYAPIQPAKPTAESNTTGGPSPDKKEDRANNEAKQTSWFEELMSPVKSNWPLIAVAIWGILVARSTLRVIARQVDVMERQTRVIRRQALSMRRQTTILRESAAATRIAAEATEKSVKLQEVAMRQWVDIEDLRARSEPPFSSGMTEGALVFTFHVKNPTKIPLTFEWLIVRVNQQRYAITFHHFLPPDDIYPIKIPITIRNKQVEEYGSNKLVLSFIATVGYTDAFEKPQRQPFGVMCLLGPQGQCNISPYEGALPDDELEKQKQPEGAI